MARVLPLPIPIPLPMRGIVSTSGSTTPTQWTRSSYAQKAFPAMKSAVDYWFKKLVKAADGTYECPNEWSPEHGPTENATAHSQQFSMGTSSNQHAQSHLLFSVIAWCLSRSATRSLLILRSSMTGAIQRLIPLTDRLISVSGNTLHSLTTQVRLVLTSIRHTVTSPI